MSDSSESNSHELEREGQVFAADSLAVGVAVMLAMTIIQRFVGFFRSIWICRMMDDTEVGQWAMAIGFILLMTPVMMFGVPGSLPRYVERFRKQGHLRAFVRNLAWATFCFTMFFLLAVTVVPQTLSWFIFLEPQNRMLIYSVGAAVAATSAFYFLNELLSGLRQVRMVSIVQFTHSISFTILAFAALYAGFGLIGIILSFAVAALIAMLPGLWVLRSGWSKLPESSEPFRAPKVWRMLLPYAAALWAMNMLGNVFDLADRYMILHLTPGGEMLGQAAVGQYHSGRMIPVLLLGLGTLVSGILMPYLSADWENGKKDAVRDRMKKTLLIAAALFTSCGAATIVLAPWLFGTLLQGRYEDGLSLMPMAFVFCSWSAMVTIGEAYLLVVERGKLVAIAIAVGLVANIGLNAVLLPLFGLHGAVLATLAAHGIVMLGLWIAMAKSDFRFDHSIVYISLLPATLLLSPWVAMFFVVTCITCHGDTRNWMAEIANQAIQRVRELRVSTASA